MKRYWVTLIAGVLLGLSPTNSPGSVSFSAGLDINSTADFDAPLASLGAWVNVGSYGRCWRPSRVDVGWQPYTDGQWVYTDAGWYWDSDEPFAWACYHYGSWVDDPAYGWVWIPGVEWAPAWVTWRQGPDYIGWAPCGPNGSAPPDAAFAFVDERHFHDHLNRHEMAFNDRAIFARTHLINDNFRREDRMLDGRQQRVVVDNGPSVARIQHDTGTRFNAQPISEVTARTRVPDNVRRTSPVRNNHEYQSPARTPEQNLRQPGSEYRQPAPNYRQPTSDFRQPAARDENHAPVTAPPVQNREVAPPTYRQDVTPPTRDNQYRNVPDPVPSTPRQTEPPSTYRREVPPPTRENQYREVPVPDRPREAVPRRPSEAVPQRPSEAVPQRPSEALPQRPSETLPLRPVTPPRAPTSPDMTLTPRQSEQAVPRTGGPPNAAVQGRTATRPPVQPPPPAQQQQKQQQDQNGH